MNKVCVVCNEHKVLGKQWDFGYLCYGCQYAMTIYENTANPDDGEWVEFSTLKGMKFDTVRRDGDKIHFVLGSGKESGYTLLHIQDCCEHVYIESIDGGNIEDISGHVILDAYESKSRDDNAAESGTWSFYIIRTMYDTVTIRFYGTSNGYYSESAQLVTGIE